MGNAGPAGSGRGAGARRSPPSPSPASSPAARRRPRRSGSSRARSSARIARLEDARDTDGDRLGSFLRHPDPDLRLRAATALGRMPYPEYGEEVTETLLSGLADGDGRVRAGAAFALGMRGDPRAGGALLGLAVHRLGRDPLPLVRARAVEAASRLDVPEQRLELLRALRDESSLVRLEAAQGAHRWSREEPSAAAVDQKLLEHLTFEGERDVLAMTLYALQRRKAPEALDAFLTYAGSRQPLERLWAVGGLAALEPDERVAEGAGDGDARPRLARGLRGHRGARRLPPGHPARRARGRRRSPPGARAPRRLGSPGEAPRARRGSRGVRAHHGLAGGLRRALCTGRPLARGAHGFRRGAGPLPASRRNSADPRRRRGAARERNDEHRGVGRLRDGPVTGLAGRRAGRGRRGDPAAPRAACRRAHRRRGPRGARPARGRARAGLPAPGAGPRGQRAAPGGGAGPARDARRRRTSSPWARPTVRARATCPRRCASTPCATWARWAASAPRRWCWRALQDRDPFVRRVALEVLEQHWPGAAAAAAASAEPAEPPGEAWPGQEPAVYRRNPRVRIATSRGDLVFELFPREAPVHVHNFLDARRARALRRDDLPPRRARLRDPGRRLPRRRQRRHDLPRRRTRCATRSGRASTCAARSACRATRTPTRAAASSS